MNFYEYNNKVMAESEIPISVDRDILNIFDVKIDSSEGLHTSHIHVSNNTILVKIGEKDKNHPMDTEHHIIWIKLEIDGVIVKTIDLDINSDSSALFLIENMPLDELLKHKIIVYSLCSQGHVWKNEYKSE